MKKIFKNNKGFTLIELLAVIVVLAIIMVIATQQVNGTIKKARGESFYETVQSIRKNMQTVCATDNKIDATTLIAATSASDVEFSLKEKDTSDTSKDPQKGNADLYGILTVKAKANGKFTNVIFPAVNKKIYTPGKVKIDNSTEKEMEAGKTVDTPEISFYTECPTTATKKTCATGDTSCNSNDIIFKDFEGTK